MLKSGANPMLKSGANRMSKFGANRMLKFLWWPPGGNICCCTFSFVAYDLNEFSVLPTYTVSIN